MVTISQQGLNCKAIVNSAADKQLPWIPVINKLEHPSTEDEILVLLKVMNTKKALKKDGIVAEIVQ